MLTGQMKKSSFKILSSEDTGLSLGVTALAVKKSALLKHLKSDTGGGTARIISPEWVVWAKKPDRFEPGTPQVVNVIAFAIALLQIKKYGTLDIPNDTLSVPELLYADEWQDFKGKQLLDKLRHAHIGRNILVPSSEGLVPFINLDHAASTPTFSPVMDVFFKMLKQPRHVQEEVVKEVKKICAAVLGAPANGYDIIFTANTTESINRVAADLPDEESEPVVMNTYLEHNSNELPWRAVPGVSLIRVPIDPDGFIDLQQMENYLLEYNKERKHGKKRIVLVTVSGASNVLGTCNDLTAVSTLVHRYGAYLMVDAAQLVGHRSINMHETGVDYLVFSAHKMYAPFGSGALIVRKGLMKTYEGPDNIENAAGIAAMGKALNLLHRIGFDLIQKEEHALLERLLAGMISIHGITIHGIKQGASLQKKTGVVAFHFEKMLSSGTAKEMAKKGIGVRYGCHCSHILIKHLLHVGPGLEKFQRIIARMISGVEFPGVTRASIGIENTPSEIDRFLDVLNAAAMKIVNHSQNRNTAGNFRKEMKNYIENRMAEIYPY